MPGVDHFILYTDPDTQEATALSLSDEKVDCKCSTIGGEAVLVVEGRKFTLGNIGATYTLQDAE